MDFEEAKRNANSGAKNPPSSVADIDTRAEEGEEVGQRSLLEHPQNWTEMVFDKLPDTVEEIFPIKAIHHPGEN